MIFAIVGVDVMFVTVGVEFCACWILFVIAVAKTPISLKCPQYSLGITGSPLFAEYPDPLNPQY